MCLSERRRRPLGSCCRCYCSRPRPEPPPPPGCHPPSVSSVVGCSWLVGFGLTLCEQNMLTSCVDSTQRLAPWRHGGVSHNSTTGSRIKRIFYSDRAERISQSSVAGSQYERAPQPPEKPGLGIPRSTSCLRSSLASYVDSRRSTRTGTCRV